MNQGEQFSKFVVKKYDPLWISYRDIEKKINKIYLNIEKKDGKVSIVLTEDIKNEKRDNINITF